MLAGWLQWSWKKVGSHLSGSTAAPNAVLISDPAEMLQNLTAPFIQDVTEMKCKSTADKFVNHRQVEEDKNLLLLSMYCEYVECWSHFLYYLKIVINCTEIL